MKAYWDASALVEAASDLLLRSRLHNERGFTRTHSLAEIFSVLTGGRLAIRLDADAAARVIDNLSADLDFIDLNSKEVLAAFKEAQKRGVRGGRVHDYMHARAADKSGAGELLTTDQWDLGSLTDTTAVTVI